MSELIRCVLGVGLAVSASLGALIAVHGDETAARSLPCRPAQGAQVSVLYAGAVGSLSVLWTLASPYSNTMVSQVPLTPLGFGKAGASVPPSPGYTIRGVSVALESGTVMLLGATCR